MVVAVPDGRTELSMGGGGGGGGVWGGRMGWMVVGMVSRGWVVVGMIRGMALAGVGMVGVGVVGGGVVEVAVRVAVRCVVVVVAAGCEVVVVVGVWLGSGVFGAGGCGSEWHGMDRSGRVP